MEPPPGSVKVVLAEPTTLPALADVKVAENWPLALVVPLKGPAGVGLAPLEAVRLMVTDWPDTGWKPLPSPLFRNTVAVKVCGAPTTLMSLGGVMVMYSSWKIFTALAL